MRLLAGTIVAALVLACCLACDVGNTNTCISNQGGVTNCGPGSAVVDGQPSTSAPSIASAAPPSTSQPASPSASSAPPATAVAAVSSAPISKYLSNLDSVGNSGWLLTGTPQVNGRYYPNSVVTYFNGPGTNFVSYNLGRQWQTLDMTLGLDDRSAANAPVEFQVVADQRTVYTGTFALGQSKHIRLNVRGVLRLELDATLLTTNYDGVYADWCSAELLS